MSYILDALKKTERDHALARGLGFSDAARLRRLEGRWTLRWIALGVLVLIGVTAVTAWRVHALWSAPVVVEPASPPPAAAAGSPPQTVAPVAAVAAKTEAVAPSSGATPGDEAAPAAPEAARASPPATEPSFLWALPPELQRSLPPMTVNVHVYSPEPSQQILYINNREYRPGERVPGGATVEQIVPDGVVMEYRGQRFKLPRPS